MDSKENKDLKTVSLSERINNYLWKDINMDETISGSHRISKDNLYKLRLFFLLYSISVYIVGITEYKYAIFENVMYLTAWGLYMNIIYFYLAIKIMKDKQFEIKYWKVAHILFEIGYSAQIVIAVLFWVAIYPTITREKNFLYFYQSVSEHGGMYIVLFIDKIVNNIKFYKRHSLFLVLFIVTYLSYNVIITFAYKPVYSIVCWTKPLSFILSASAIFAALLNFGVGILYDNFFKQSQIQAKKEQKLNENNKKST